MAIRLPKFSGGNSNKKSGISLKQKLEELTDKMPYHYWVVAAGVVSVLLGCMVYFSMSSDDEKMEEEKPQIAMVQVVAANQDINPRAIIKDNMLKLIDMPEGSVPAGAIMDMAEIRNLPASILIQNGDIITKNKVLSNPRMAGFTGTIPPDCRAMSVAISDVTGVAGFAHPGDYVDIMLTVNDKDNGQITSNIVLQNILLLGINKAGSSAESNPDGKRVNNNDNSNEQAGNSGEKKEKDPNEGNINASKDAMATATLALTPTQTMQLAAAAEKGKIYLVLRPFKPRDNYTFDTQYVTLLPQKKNDAPAAPSAQPAPAPQRTVTASPAPEAPKAPTGSVEVFRGSTGTREGR